MSSSSDAHRVVIVATGNRHKVEEISSALLPFGWEFVTAADIGAEALDIEETGLTFLDNARLKAHAYHKAFGMSALADDSGLEVDVLGGAPGVMSARYAGGCCSGDAENNARLMMEMELVPEDKRRARFRSVIVLVDENGDETVAGGTCEGAIGFEPRGEMGFGYDPLFHPDATPGRTMAELSMDEKNAISHRGAALANLRELLDR
ncbi:MAG: RdgB/HAM1 family non-canonical purine NTP pyrophosphatase [Coriobacteriia bacterium]